MTTQYSIKYRPRKWEEVFGQNDIVKSLRKRVIEDNIPKAILLQGQFGIGKSTLAYLFSAAVQAHLEDGNPDWNHPSNKSIVNETFDRDTMLLDGSQLSGKDDMVGFMSTLKTKPMYDRKRIYIIEEVDQLSNAAILSLLKILENPSSNTHFILLSMENKVPAAIKSRCQVYNLKPLKLADTMRAMKHVMEETGDWNREEIPQQFKTEGLASIASSSKGSLRTAMQNLEACLNAEAYTKEEIESLLNTVDEVSASNILMGLLDKSKDSNLWQTIYSSDPMELYNYLTLVISNAMIYKTTGYCENERFEESTKKIANHENVNLLFNNLVDNPQLTKPFMRKADLLGALAKYMITPKLGLHINSLDDYLKDNKPQQPAVRQIPVRTRGSNIPF